MPVGPSMIVDEVRQSNGENVLERFRHGDVDAFEALFREHQRAVYGWILRMVRDDAAAEDLTVETFWRIFQAHAHFDAARGFAPWARRVATRTALDWLRAQRPHTEIAAEIAAPSPPDPVENAEIRSSVAQAFARLPAKLRAAALLAVVEEQPHKEIAAALGISVAAVKVRTFRALRLLRKELEKQGIMP
jgi:RNA polymerase sigma factor (sigma-70 family)